MPIEPGHDDLHLGATGRFPDGRINEHDEGELRAAIAADRKKNRVVIDFGKPVAFIALTREGAIEFARIVAAKGMQLVPKELGGK